MGFQQAAIGRFVSGGASVLPPRAAGFSRAGWRLRTGDRIGADEG